MGYRSVLNQYHTPKLILVLSSGTDHNTGGREYIFLCIKKTLRQKYLDIHQKINEYRKCSMPHTLLYQQKTICCLQKKIETGDYQSQYNNLDLKY